MPSISLPLPKKGITLSSSPLSIDHGPRQWKLGFELLPKTPFQETPDIYYQPILPLSLLMIGENPPKYLQYYLLQTLKSKDLKRLKSAENTGSKHLKTWLPSENPSIKNKVHLYSLLMNEYLFFIHILLLLGFISIAFRFGKSALMTICTLQTIFANLFILKQIQIFGLTVTPTDAYTIGSFFTLNLIREHYGMKEAKKIIHLNLLFLLFFVAMSIIQVNYAPDKVDFMHQNYASILLFVPRIFIVSLISFYLSQFLDMTLFAKLRARFSLTPAMLFSLSISQLFDTIFFSYGALAGTVSNIASIIFFSYLIKLVTILFMSIFTSKVQKVVHE